MKYGPARARYERRKLRRQMFQSYARLWNALSVILGLGTLVLAGWFVWKLISDPGNPGITSNPTQSGSGNLIVTTAVPVSISTEPSVELPTETPAIVLPTLEDTSNYTFDLQARAESISARLFNQERTCNWMGIAGQVFDLQGRPIPGVTVQVSGPMYGKDIQFLSMTGSAPSYGEGGYEIFLSDKPVDTKGDFEVRLVDQKGRGLSPRFTFNTSSDCEKNLVIMNFKQIK